ncbi:hydrogen gas-evolving membrane-bound hydrogenase subunit E [Abyssisolibacter fermentans]|uniref:hydrogen gas-evolving membrane-bound hydrogenase subunit E n=1 Tax=Abyssisolibacter fermentans TaxID=1766203 RepID=UPI000836758B|nr:hydrogen gas-evolving membrane-bound hydrogenase subunit E [Abyssisolibacter fermentans]
MRIFLSIIITIIIISILLLGVCDLADFHSDKAFEKRTISKKYIDDSVKDTGAINVVTGIILDYRAFDTFCEATVLFTGVICIVILLLKK